MQEAAGLLYGRTTALAAHGGGVPLPDHGRGKSLKRDIFERRHVEPTGIPGRELRQDEVPAAGLNASTVWTFPMAHMPISISPKVKAAAP